jgi:hypothetical protein
LEFADDIVLISNASHDMQIVLDRLAVEVERFGMCFAPSKCKVLLQDLQGAEPALTLAGDTLEIVDHFIYLGSCVTAGGGVGEEISHRIARARAAFANLKHLWRRRDIRLILKGRIYRATVRAILLYGCETWPLRAEDVRRLSVFEHRCLRSIARIWWQQRASNYTVRQKVLGSDSPTLGETISLHRLRWLGHVLRMPAQRLPYRVLYLHSRDGTGRRKEGVRTSLGEQA